MSIVSIITVNYNQAAVTCAFLGSVRENAGAVSVELILVDNAPLENNEATFKAVYPDLIYILSPKNLGFAGGNNLGIKNATGQYVLLLNNDTEITKGFLETLIEEMESRPDIGLLSPLIRFYANKELIQYAGFSKMNYCTGRNKGIGYLEKDNGQYNHSYETGFCHGAAVMCRKEDLLKAGLMDENYFLYYEELDWCEKFKRIGKKIWFTGKAAIFHKESITVGEFSTLKIFFMTRNRMLFIRRNASFIQGFIFGVYYTFLVGPAQILKYFLKGRQDLAKAVYKGLTWNFTHSKNSTDLGYKIA